MPNTLNDSASDLMNSNDSVVSKSHLNIGSQIQDPPVPSLPPVLIVDDEAMNIEVLRIMLTEGGVKVEIAMGGAAALDAIAKRAQMVVEQG